MNISLTQKHTPASVGATPVNFTSLNWLLKATDRTGFATVKAEFGKS